MISYPSLLHSLSLDFIIISLSRTCIIIIIIVRIRFALKHVIIDSTTFFSLITIVIDLYRMIIIRSDTTECYCRRRDNIPTDPTDGETFAGSVNLTTITGEQNARARAYNTNYYYHRPAARRLPMKRILLTRYRYFTRLYVCPGTRARWRHRRHNYRPYAGARREAADDDDGPPLHLRHGPSCPGHVSPRTAARA